MSRAFRVPCASPGCGVATLDRYCGKHSAPNDRASSTAQGYGRAHQKWRRRVLALDPICHWPLDDGRLCMRPATVADHIVPLKVDPSRRYDDTNGNGLCVYHHGSKRREERRGIYRSTR
jgi:hypothetical protein